MALSHRSFGVELECIVRHREPATSNRRQYAKVARHICGYTGINIANPDDTNYNELLYGRLERRDWIITSDASVAIETSDFRYSRERQLYPTMPLTTWTWLWNGTEIVSPKLDENRWEEVAAILRVLQVAPMGVIYNSSTSTHLHIGIQIPEEPSLDLMLAVSYVARVGAIYYLFETYINLLCPDIRVNTFCCRCRRSGLARRKSQREYINALYQARGLYPIAEVMNFSRWDDGDTPESRYFGANFMNVTQVNNKWTVEFRSHEGTKDSDDLECWGKLLLRLFDQAVATDWTYIISLVDLTDAFADERGFGDEDNRDLPEWREWVTEMHYLFLEFLAGAAIREKHADPDKRHVLEQYFLSREELTDAEYADDEVRPEREEEMLMKNLTIYLRARLQKFKPQYEQYMRKNFQTWESDNPRDFMLWDYQDYPNPSGIVRDHIGRDIPVNWRHLPNTDYSRFPVV